MYEDARCPNNLKTSATFFIIVLCRKHRVSYNFADRHDERIMDDCGAEDVALAQEILRNTVNVQKILRWDGTEATESARNLECCKIPITM